MKPKTGICLIFVSSLISFIGEMDQKPVFYNPI